MILILTTLGTMECSSPIWSSEVGHPLLILLLHG